ncbi:glycosyltransferase family 39 protein [Sphingomonas sp. KRR8]|uniref:ArnT family glycosyltransferase n=1 Tax=Sphingomonas sp. KRR8 TaxID=2942996 RepID=UPI002021029B|nr:glycosyltransferase family 39 protein [Sphingomonas sp. KRR8]URD61865.1 glycosyltransferase family 39 protein [Sphingomonas sp. KRR8]
MFWKLLFLVASAIFLFVDPRISPIALQDEARNANNALEMYLTGPSLITTFDFRPDLWNTKPPLLIWLMDASMTLFGPSEWAIRLPSALAALGTLLATLLFTRRVTGSLPVALLAGTMLLLSPGFFGEHGARTADFDATLTFFVTVALQLIFFAVHRAKPTMASMLLIGALVAGGAMTKSTAAFIPVAGVLVYVALVGRLKRVLRLAPRYSVAVATAIIPLLGFYLLREAAGPGYLAAAYHNDMAGRFSEALNVETRPTFYLTSLLPGWFFGGAFLIATPLAFAKLLGRTRLLLIYAASIVLFSLLVLSAATNRALQYALPLFPWLSILAALAFRHLVSLAVKSWGRGRRVEPLVLAAALGLAVGLPAYQAAYWRYKRFPARDFYPQSSYGDLFAALAARGVTDVTVVDPGIMHLGKPGYAPLLRWHQLVWREKGLRARRAMVDQPQLRLPIASCEPTISMSWGAGAERLGSCAVLWRRPVAAPVRG